MKIFNSFLSGAQKKADAERIVRLIYFGLLRRLPEKTTQQALAEQIKHGTKPEILLENVMGSAEFRQQVPADQNEIYLELFQSETHNSGADTFKFTGAEKQHRTKNIIYLCPAISWPIGGVKVLIRHSEMINSPLIEGISSEIYFPDAPNFHLNWFEHRAKIKRDATIHVDQDFIIIPEICALKYGAIFNQERVKYAIFVQNGYSIFDEILQGNRPDLFRLKEIYQNSAAILVVSEDTACCVCKAFDIQKGHIYLTPPSINQNLFNIKTGPKENIITYMPRKLSNHSKYVINHFVMKNHSDWQVMPIEGINENEVARALSLSKIFLSFSDREGLSLPPLEAALCGNVVIGYTGEGAKEYWNSALFREISSGNLLDFIKVIEQEMVKFAQKASQEALANERALALTKLAQKYSTEAEINQLRAFMTKVALATV